MAAAFGAQGPPCTEVFPSLRRERGLLTALAAPKLTGVHHPQLPEKEWRDMVEAAHARACPPHESDALPSAAEAAVLRKKLVWGCHKRGSACTLNLNPEEP